MAVKTTTGYSFPTIPTKYDSADKAFINAVKKLFDTLFSFKIKATKDIANIPKTIWNNMYPVGVIVWSDSNRPPRWPTETGGTWTGMGSVTTDGNKTLYAYKRTA